MTTANSNLFIRVVDMGATYTAGDGIVITAGVIELDPDIFDIPLRTLLDSTQLKSVDWEDRILYNSAEDPSLDWELSKMYDDAGEDSVLWELRRLSDDTGEASVDWSPRYLYDTVGQYSANWGNRSLYDAAGVQSLYWTNRTLNDDAGQFAINWQLRSLSDDLGLPAISWQAREAYDSATPSNPIFNWNTEDTFKSLAIHSNFPLVDYASNALALAGGLLVGDLYQTSGVVMIVV